MGGGTHLFMDGKLPSADTQLRKASEGGTTYVYRRMCLLHAALLRLTAVSVYTFGILFIGMGGTAVHS